MMQKATLRELLQMNNTGGKMDLLRTVATVLMWKSTQPEKKSLNNKPSPLDAPRLLRTTPRKRAVLIGVSYKKQQYELKGTINDVKKMKKWLIDNFGFSESNVLILTGSKLLEDPVM